MSDQVGMVTKLVWFCGQVEMGLLLLQSTLLAPTHLREQKLSSFGLAIPRRLKSLKRRLRRMLWVCRLIMSLLAQGRLSTHHNKRWKVQWASPKLRRIVGSMPWSIPVALLVLWGVVWMFKSPGLLPQEALGNGDEQLGSIWLPDSASLWMIHLPEQPDWLPEAQRWLYPPGFSNSTTESTGLMELGTLVPSDAYNPYSLLISESDVLTRSSEQAHAMRPGSDNAASSISTATPPIQSLELLPTLPHIAETGGATDGTDILSILVPNSRVPCVSCDKTFVSDKDRRRHHETVHEKKKNASCDQCDQKFGRKDNRDRHVRKVHKKCKDQTSTGPATCSDQATSSPGNTPVYIVPVQDRIPPILANVAGMEESVPGVNTLSRKRKNAFPSGENDEEATREDCRVKQRKVSDSQEEIHRLREVIKRKDAEMQRLKEENGKLRDYVIKNMLERGA